MTFQNTERVILKIISVTRHPDKCQGSSSASHQLQFVMATLTADPSQVMQKNVSIFWGDLR